MRRIGIIVGIILLLFAQKAVAEELKIGFVDFVKALNESDAGKKAKADLEFLIKSKQTFIDEKGKSIEKIRGELEKQSSVLSEDARKSKEDELERLLREYQRLVADSQNEVKKKEGELTADIIKELRQIVQKYGKDKGYSFIIENAEGLVLYSRENIDITETIIKLYNESKLKTKN